MAKESLQLAVHFLLHTYLHTKKKLRYVANTHPPLSTGRSSVLPSMQSVVSSSVDTEEWMATVEVLLSKSREACQWMVQYLVGQEGREITRSVLSLNISNRAANLWVSHGLIQNRFLGHD